MGRKLAVAFVNTLQTNRNFQYTKCEERLHKGEVFLLLRTNSAQTTLGRDFLGTQNNLKICGDVLVSEYQERGQELPETEENIPE